MFILFKYRMTDSKTIYDIKGKFDTFFLLFII